MFEYIILLIALVGTGLAGWQDFKTTGVEDKYAVFMGLGGIFIHLINSYITGVWSGFYYSLIVGFTFLVFGYIMYYSHQWGEADVLILGALGFLIPTSLSIFAKSLAFPYYPALFLATVFIIGGVYSIFYSVGVAFRTKDFFKKLTECLVSHSWIFLNVSVLIFIISIFSLSYVINNLNVYVDLIARQFLIIYMFFVAGFVLIAFSKTIDQFAFRKQVNTSDLIEGDVLAENIIFTDDKYSKKFKGKLFIGLEAEDIKSIRQIKDKVWVKQGIPFVPAFFFSVIFMWLFGNVFTFMF
ncbi:MAG: hypothetical protein K0B07_04045 [DPANN group archaeon]|nr:hypothetical protein [DPANN group archaeon]